MLAVHPVLTTESAAIPDTYGASMVLPSMVASLTGSTRCMRGAIEQACEESAQLSCHARFVLLFDSSYTC